MKGIHNKLIRDVRVNLVYEMCKRDKRELITVIDAVIKKTYEEYKKERKAQFKVIEFSAIGDDNGEKQEKSCRTDCRSQG